MNRFLLVCCFCLPLRHLVLTSGYGYRVHPVTVKYTFHAGVDLRAHRDTVFAVLAGSVKSCGYDPVLGIYIRLEHGDVESIYGHLSQIFVLPGDSVSSGDPVAISGSTGRVTGEHLHFSIKYRQRYTDPLKFLLVIANNLKQQ